MNLRGVRESGLAFALPTYAFIVSMVAIVLTGVARCADGSCGPTDAPDPMAVGVGGLGIFVLLRAFASGASALTGVEAIANGVSAFRPPQARNAAQTLGILGVLAIMFFLGVSFLAVRMTRCPSRRESVPLSQIARVAFPDGSPSGFMYYAVQGTTVAILVLAANTAFQGFPRLAALLAHDRFARASSPPRRPLVYSNGILVLAAVAAAADLDLPRRRRRPHPPLRRRRFHGLHALAGRHGPVLATDPRAGWRPARPSTASGLLHRHRHRRRHLDEVRRGGVDGDRRDSAAVVLVSLGIHRHYAKLVRRLRAGTGAARTAGIPRNQVVLVTDALDVAAEGALWYARSVTDDPIRALHVPTRHTDPGIRPRWFRFAGPKPRLEVFPDQDAVVEELWKLPRGDRDVVTVVVPEQFRRASLISAARRPSFRLKLRLLAEPGVVVTDVPAISDRHGPEGRTPARLVTRVLISDVNAASMRAVNYAKSLGVPDTRAVFFAADHDEADDLEREDGCGGSPLSLEISDAPYRDIGEPLLRYLRELTAEQDVAVNVVMPELVFRGWRRLLHNQRALYIKRLLLFEPRVILTSVPYQLFR